MSEQYLEIRDFVNSLLEKQLQKPVRKNYETWLNGYLNQKTYEKFADTLVYNVSVKLGSSKNYYCCLNIFQNDMPKHTNWILQTFAGNGQRIISNIF